MPAVVGSAPGKIILFGEHAVVYGRPAIAVPVTQVRAKVTISADPAGPRGQVRLTAGDIHLENTLDALPPNDPLAAAIRCTAEQLGIIQLPAMHLRVSSTIPIASGLGSGAAVSAAIARALSGFLGCPLTDEQVSQIAFKVDQLHHGTPSGVDNTVIAYAQPVYFVRGQPFERLLVERPFTVVIGNTGIASPTSQAVGDVRQRWQADPLPYERLFDEIGEIVGQARQALETGRVEALGPLMTRNHALLQQIDVSSPELDRLVSAALQAGASGAKLCGGGRGGNMIAMVEAEQAAAVAAALRAAGAVNTIQSTIP